jgi:hypothetical protein
MPRSNKRGPPTRIRLAPQIRPTIVAIDPWLWTPILFFVALPRFEISVRRAVAIRGRRR